MKILPEISGGSGVLETVEEARRRDPSHRGGVQKNFALEIVHFSVFWVTILCKYHVYLYNSMQRDVKTVPIVSIRHKKPRY